MQIKVPTGLFIPILSCGAIMGRLLGIGIEQMVYHFPDCPLWSSACQTGHSCVTPGLYAMVGAAAALGIYKIFIFLFKILKLSVNFL